MLLTGNLDISKISSLTVAEAFEKGTNIRTVMREKPIEGRLVIAKALIDLVKFMDAKKQFQMMMK